MPHTQMLTERFAPMVKKNKQKAFFSYLLQHYPQAAQTDFGIVLGDPDNAKLVVSTRFSGNLSGIAVLMELLSILTEPNRSQICFVFAVKNVVFPGRPHICIGNLDKGNHVIIAATAAARTRFGQTVKQAFQPSAKCSLQFKHAESVFCRYSQNRYDLFICTKKQRKLFPPRSSPSMLGFYTDPPCVKMVCKGIAKLSKIL